VLGALEYDRLDRSPISRFERVTSGSRRLNGIGDEPSGEAQAVLKGPKVSLATIVRDLRRQVPKGH
jgi:hypothetical protein